MTPTLDLAQIKSFTDDLLLSCNLIWDRIFTNIRPNPERKTTKARLVPMVDQRFWLGFIYLQKAFIVINGEANIGWLIL